MSLASTKSDSDTDNTSAESSKGGGGDSLSFDEFQALFYSNKSLMQFLKQTGDREWG